MEAIINQRNKGKPMMKKYFKTLLYLVIFIFLAQPVFALNIVELSPGYYPQTAAGRPLATADIYVGTPDLDPTVVANQKTLSVQQEDGTVVAVAQPIHTNAGGVPTYLGSPVTLLVEGDYSLAVLDSSGVQIYYVPSTVYEQYLVAGNYYYPDYLEADQGVVGGGETVTDILADVGATEKATMYFSHNSEGNTTTYTFTTNTAISANYSIIIEEGVILNGVGTLTFDSPDQIIARPNQQVFGASITVASVDESTTHPEWWGENTTPGTTDMITELQAAADLGNVILQNYSYAVSLPLTIDTANNRSLMGMGWGSKIIALASFAGDEIIKVDDVTGIILKDFMIEGISAGAYADYTSGIRTYDNIDDLLIERVKVINSRFDGIRIQTPSVGLNYRVKIKDCHIEDTGWIGITIYDTSIAEISGNYVSETGYDGIFIGEDVTDCKVSKNHVTKAVAPTYIYNGAGGLGGVEGGFLISYQPDAVNLTITDNTVIDNTTAGYDGIGIQNEDADGTLTENIVISGNTVTNTGLFGIDCLSNMAVTGNTVNGAVTAGIVVTLDTGGTIQNLSVTGNIIKNITGTAYGIILSIPSTSGDLIVKSATFTGNTVFDDQGVPTTDYGLGYDQGIDLEDVLVIGNNFAEVTTTSIYAYGVSANDDEVKCINNHGRADQGTVASGASITLPVDSDFIVVTGNTNIGDITASWQSRIVTLYFNEALTVADASTNILLAASGNFVVGASDRLMLIWNGTNWLEVSRTVN